MKRFFVVITTGLLCIARPNEAQTTDWAQVFQNAVVRDPAINDRARERMVNQILPRLLAEDPSLASAEVSGILDQFNRKDSDGIRGQASAVFVVIAQFRSDSAVVLTRALPALMEHVRDSVPQVRINSLNSLCMLRPEIPAEQVKFLIQVISDRNDPLAPEAMLGVARMTNSRPEAADAIANALAQDSAADWKIAAIQRSRRPIRHHLSLCLGLANS